MLSLNNDGHHLARAGDWPLGKALSRAEVNGLVMVRVTIVRS